MARRRWGLAAVAGLLLGAILFIIGDRFGYHGVRLFGAIIMAAGCLCAVVRLAGDFEREEIGEARGACHDGDPGADAVGGGVAGGVGSVDEDRGGRPMNDAEIRKRVQARLADVTLPRQLPMLAQPLMPWQSPPPTATLAGSALRDRCAVCDERSPQIRYNQADGPVAFHQRCHEIWKEEANKPIRRG